MNPAALIGTLGERGFLIGLVLGLIAGIAALAHRRGSLWLLGTGAASILGLLIAQDIDELPEPTAGPVAAAVVVVILGSIGVWLLSREVGHGTVAACLALTALGVWSTVPDTELAVVLLGATLGGMIGAVRLEEQAIGPVWPVALLGSAAFVAVVDGRGRESAPVGALAVFGVLLLFPLIFGLFERLPAWLVILAQITLVVVAGRVAGTATSATAAVVIAVTAHIAVGVALVIAGRWLSEPE